MNTNDSKNQASAKQTKLINYKTYDLDKSKITPIDRTSIFGNPFFINETTTRRLSVKLYKNCFYKRIKWDKKFRVAVQNLKGKTLGCWCVPLPCHGDVIIKYLEGLE